VPVSPLVWTSAPIVATSIAVGWVSWHGRTRRPRSEIDTVAEHERFRSALAQSRRRVTGG
jgi:hypothetical protein